MKLAMVVLTVLVSSPAAFATGRDSQDQRPPEELTTYTCQTYDISDKDGVGNFKPFDVVASSREHRPVATVRGSTYFIYHSQGVSNMFRIQGADLKEMPKEADHKLDGVGTGSSKGELNLSELDGPLIVALVNCEIKN